MANLNVHVGPVARGPGANWGADMCRALPATWSRMVQQLDGTPAERRDELEEQWREWWSESRPSSNARRSIPLPAPPGEPPHD